MFKHLPDFTRSVRREKRAVGPFSTLLYNKNAIFMPRKQSASLHWRGKWKAGAAATLRLPTHGPARGAPTPCEDRAEALSHVIPTGCWASWDLRGVLLVSPEESLVFPQHLTGGGGDCPRVTVCTHILKPEPNREMSTIQFIQHHFAYVQCGWLCLRTNINRLRIQR